MEDIGPVLATTIYHPKGGQETEFVKIWTNKVARLAYYMGSDDVHIYHNENTREFVATIHWPSKTLASIFLESLEFTEATKAVNAACLIPSSKQSFEILRERAA